MPAIRTGQTFNCMICGEPFYRSRNLILRGVRLTCGKPECKSAARSGPNNPFWGKQHDDKTRAKIKAGRARNPPKGTGPKKGVFKQSSEARAKMSAALRQRWIDHRDKMIAALPRGLDHHYAKEPELRRYRKNFSPLQRREWAEDKCRWCGSTERLNLDHIIPIFDGGTNDRANAQTLCHPCNLWKTSYVDRPRYFARLGSKGDQI